MIDYCLIRHKSSGEYMPLLTNNKGYTHWNPKTNQRMEHRDLKVPRLFKSRIAAKRAVVAWYSLPNAGNRLRILYSGEEDWSLDTKDDGRKMEDLVIVPVTLLIGEPV